MCQEIINHVGCKNYDYEGQEADDLIYAFCRLRRKDRILIISRDGDFQQIPYLFPNVDLFDPMCKEDDVWKVDDADPVDLKCFEGDTGDNIIGYDDIGPVRARQLVLEDDRRTNFFKTHGEEKFLFNRILVDLTLCPYVLQNLSYVDNILRSKTSFDIKKIHEIIIKHKVRGLAGSISSSILPFKFLRSENQN